MRRHRLIWACLIAVVLVFTLASCLSSESSTPTVTLTPILGTPGVTATASAAPTESPSTKPARTSSAGSEGNTSLGGTIDSQAGSASSANPPSINSYRQFDQDVARLLERQAVWQTAKRIKVHSTARIGLVIGDPSLLRTEIRALVPGSYPQAAGPVKVGSTIDVQLLADPNDASVIPNEAIDNSIGEHTALLWTWYVYATHPDTSPGLFLTAEVVTKMSDGHVVREELSLTIPVDRTWQYTLYQIFTNWATWLSIVTVLLAALGWTWRRRTRRSSMRRDDTEQHPTPATLSTTTMFVNTSESCRTDIRLLRVCREKSRGSRYTCESAREAESQGRGLSHVTL